MAEVIGEELDCALACIIKDIASDLALNGGGDQTIVAIENSRGYVAFSRAVVAKKGLCEEIVENDLGCNRNVNLQKTFFFAAADS